jgi:hypothetical protein
MIDLAFTMAFLLSLLKLGELALRPHQKKVLQAKLEEITLTLDCAFPSYETWIAQLPRVHAGFIFLFGGIGMALSLLVVFNSTSGVFVMCALAFVLIFLSVIAASGVWSYAPRVLEAWGWGPKAIRLGALPTILIGFVASITFAITLKLLGAFITVPLLFAGFRKYYMPITGFPGIVMTAVLAYPAFWLLRPVIRFVIALLWRVVEYQGGAWMAILFISTALLGMAKLFIGS